MRTPSELMVFVLVAGLVGLAALWAVRRWWAGARQPDPAARLLGVLGLLGLGGMVGFGPWSWIADRYGAAFWLAFAAAALAFAGDWIRETRGRRRAQAGGSEGDSPAAARDRSP